MKIEIKHTQIIKDIPVNTRSLKSLLKNISAYLDKGEGIRLLISKGVENKLNAFLWKGMFNDLFLYRRGSGFYLVKVV